jgi:serine/threonine protein kinase
MPGTNPSLLKHLPSVMVSDADPLIGANLNGYIVGDVIAAGGMGLGCVRKRDDSAKFGLHFCRNATEWCLRFSAESTSRSSPNKRVYSAKHETIGRRAAVKVLKPEVAADAEWTQRFLTEARAIAALKHKNLIEVINFGKTPDNRQYLGPLC